SNTSRRQSRNRGRLRNPDDFIAWEEDEVSIGAATATRAEFAKDLSRLHAFFDALVALLTGEGAGSSLGPALWCHLLEGLDVDPSVYHHTANNSCNSHTSKILVHLYYEVRPPARELNFAFPSGSDRGFVPQEASSNPQSGN